MTTQSSTRTWLVVSLALNVFMAGAIASYFVVGDERGFAPHRHSRAHTLHPRVLRKLLPAQDQTVLDETLKSHRPKIHERVRALRQARRNVADAMRAEPFDRPQLETALGELRARETAMAEAAQAMTTELAARVSPEGRSKLAAQMTPRKRRGRGPPEENRPPD